MTRRVTRRSLLIGGAAAVTGGAAGYGVAANSTSIDRRVSTLPYRQHAWNDVLELDDHGNHTLPSHHRLLMWDLPTPAVSSANVEELEAVFASIDGSIERCPSGVIFTVGWGPGYFDEYTNNAGILAHPESLSSFETPSLTDHTMCLHIASENEELLVEVGDALSNGTGQLRDTIPPIRSLNLAELRSGFTGPGLPADRQNAGGIPRSAPVPAEAPLFMGFKSGFRRNQASEDDVTIDSGPLVGATTMHVSHMRLRLQSWYDLLDDDQRASRMFSPQAADRVDSFTNEAPTFATEADDAASSHGVVGHLQTTAGARRDGRPLLLRRDFNTTDDGQAGLHFVSLQKTIEDFNQTRRAMNGAAVSSAHAGIDARTNNGINEFILVTSRANFLIPPRRQRSFPLLNRTK